MKEQIVTSLGQLIDISTPSEPDSESGRLRDNSIYRGMPRKDWRLFTSLDRLGGLSPAHTKTHLEEHILRNFLRHARPFLKESGNLWELMVTAEHHGVPTRLLDWTHSPLIAAHFATRRETLNEDLIIWKLDWKTMHERFGLRPVAFLVTDLDRLLQDKGCEEPWQFLNRPPKEKFVCMLEPPSVSDRLVAQSGAFTLASIKSKSLDELLVEQGIGDVLTRLIIPREKAQYIRDQLDLCTINESRLFPGLDGLAADLKRYYASNGV
jgi:hypothetical protein